MKALTFYSYKGGVGRTLALVNIAKRLIEFDKKVCILDFDLEAPGIQLKYYQHFNIQKINFGIVDYIHEFVETKKIPENFENYFYTFNERNKNMLSIIPAGKIETSDYWRKLSKINWNDLFYKKENNGIKFFLDFKEKVKKYINPDYLLIDSRTGISETTGVTISILADEVVLLSANNKENFFGTQQIIKTISNSKNSISGKAPKIHFVLTRIPFSEKNKPEQNYNEKLLIKNVKQNFNNFLIENNSDYKIETLNVIHSDRDLEINETIKIGYETDIKTSNISQDYLNLFHTITEDSLTKQEKEKFINFRKSELLINEAENIDDLNEKLIKIDEAIKLNNENLVAIILKNQTLYELERYQEAYENNEKAILIDNSNVDLYYLKALISLELDDDNLIETGFKSINNANELEPNDLNILRVKNDFFIKLKYPENEIIENFKEINNKFPNNDIFFNTRANYYRSINKNDLALADIYKALEINSDEGLYYTTLAEIYANQNKIQEFYINFNIALQKEFPIKSIFQKGVIDIYKRFFAEERFLNLLEKYGHTDAMERIEKINN